ncbi:MAG: hypothetical protein WC778_08420 [Negativicutes bacterium]|jgi:hypothetical protein
MLYNLLIIDTTNRETALNNINYVIKCALATDQLQLFEKYPYESCDLLTGMFLISLYSEDGSLVGFCLLGAMEGDLLYLENIYVLKTHRGDVLRKINAILREVFLALDFCWILTFIDSSATAQLEKAVGSGWIIVGENIRIERDYVLLELNL